METNSDFILKKSNNQYTVDYRSNVIDSILHFQIEVTDTKTADMIIEESMEVDLHEGDYLKHINETLTQRSLQKDYTYISAMQAKEICISLRQAITQNNKKLSRRELLSPQVQGLYISLSFARAILKTKLNIVSQSSISRKGLAPTMTTPVLTPPSFVQPVFAQDVVESYSLGLSAFALNEDIIVNKQAFLDIVNQDVAASVQDTEGLYVFQDVLNNIPLNSFSVKYLLQELDSYIRQRPQNLSGSGCQTGWWPTGSSRGCCGNYGGCCWYWHPYCYVHDVICRKCKPALFCLSGCVPDPVATLPIEPFVFIEDWTPEVSGDYFLPQPLNSEIYFKTDRTMLEEALVQFYTPIYFNSLTLKYYSDNQYINYVPDGYYDSPSEIHGNNHKYYHITNGVVVEKINATITPY